MSLKQIVLHGELGVLFGEHWQLDVLTPAEAVFAINVNRPGFTRHLCASEAEGIGYRILLDDEPIDPAALAHPFGRETFHIVPILSGSGSDGRAVAKVVVGVVIAIASIGVGMAAYGGGMGAMGTVFSEGAMGAAMSESALLGMSYGTIAMMGASLAFTGVSQLLAKTPDLAAAQQDGSFIFAGYVNTAAQGGPIPVGYGELIVGSTVVSSGLKVKSEAV
ncbi:MAG: hypothetical protein A2075_12240 [Geobacteraceae bacterium GWC2_58_44]|nr:MAG: hypothetical protein A2075_12240 [Geobacteraceae bacterium GWC2_58_44]HBG06332.1 hypothetical protein [Geobacter sp.]